jgi:hypothetical protein
LGIHRHQLFSAIPKEIQKSLVEINELAFSSSNIDCISGTLEKGPIFLFALFQCLFRPLALGDFSLKLFISISQFSCTFFYQLLKALFRMFAFGDIPENA